MAQVRRGKKRKASEALNTKPSFSFKHPSSILICGPSGSGKTVFTTDLILHNKQLWPDTPNVVHYCYGIWQDSFKPLQKAGVRFHQGIPDPNSSREEACSYWTISWEEGSKDKTVVDLFTKYSHHKGITVIYLTQGKYAKTISRNAHYVVAFKNPRNQVAMRNLLLQAYPTKWNEVLEVFNKVTDRPFGYMVLDFHPASSDSCRILSHVLQREGYTHCYS